VATLRLGAVIKRTKNGLALEKGIYGHPPSIAFEIQAAKFIGVQTIDPPDGFDSPRGAFFPGTPGGCPGGSGAVWPWERPTARALDRWALRAALPCALRAR
jgi:hypothetical protein